MLRMRIWQRISQVVVLPCCGHSAAGGVLRRANRVVCSAVLAVAGSQQEVSTTVESAPLPRSESEVGAAEDDAVSVTSMEGLCESVGRPALTTYLSDMPQDDWVKAMEEYAFPGGIDLMKRPMVDELEWIAQMPGDTSEQVWCEAKTSHNMWLIGISWPNGQVGINVIQPNDYARAY